MSRTLNLNNTEQIICDRIFLIFYYMVRWRIGQCALVRPSVRPLRTLIIFQQRRALLVLPQQTHGG